MMTFLWIVIMLQIFVFAGFLPKTASHVSISRPNGIFIPYLQNFGIGVSFCGHVADKGASQTRDAAKDT